MALTFLSNSSIMRPDLQIKTLLAALLVAGPLYLCGTFNHDLWRPAEAREAGIACKMLENGDWTATYLNDDLFLEKPPLYTWAIAACLKIFGRHDWVVRLPVLAFTLGTLILTFYLARIRLGTAGAQGAVISLATMSLFLEVNHGAMVDNGLMFFITLALLAFYRLHAGAAHACGWAALFYTALALAFLTKGGIGPALILAAASGYTAAGRHRGIWRRAHPLLGAAILLILIGGWLGALWRQGGAEYFHVFFIRNNLDRLLGQYGPTGAWHYYLPYFFSSALPWTILLPAGIWCIWQGWQGESKRGARDYWNFMAWWVGAFFVMLSLAGGKDHQYLLPLLPPLAIVCGAWIEHTIHHPATSRWSNWLAWIFTGGAALAALAMPWLPRLIDAGHAGRIGYAAAWTLLPTAAAALAAWALAHRQWRSYWRALAALAIISGLTMGIFVEPALDRAKSIRPLSAMLRAQLPADAILWGYDLDENTVGALIFYGHRHRRLAGLGDHLRLLQESQPQWLLLMSREAGRQPDVERLLNTGSWTTQARLDAGGRWFWLLGNKH